MVRWWWIPASFGLAFIGVILFVFISSLGSFGRYLRISAM